MWLGRPRRPGGGGAQLYTALLAFLSTAIYLLIGALLAGSGALLVQYVQQGLWLGVVIVALVVIYLFTAIFGFPKRAHAVIAPLSDYPRLEALVREAATRVGARAPRWVAITPDARLALERRALWGRAPLPQQTLELGAASLALMNDRELTALLAQKLAYNQLGHSALASYFGSAESALLGIIDAARIGADTQRRAYRNARTYSSAWTMVIVILITIATLPLRFVWFGFHLLRLRRNHASFFDADAEAATAYGPQAFLNGLTAIYATNSTLRGAREGIRQDMARHNNPNFYAELRRHYAELPADYLGELRMKAIRDYRSLERLRPITPDRIRAALLLGTPEPPSAGASGAPQPAYAVLTPRGAADPSGVELQLTDLLFTSPKGRR